jgi:hypothetical protein
MNSSPCGLSNIAIRVKSDLGRRSVEIVSAALFWIGLIVGVVGWLWLAWVALQESVLWGLGTLIVPCVALVFAIMYWEEAKVPFLVLIAGNVLAAIGRFGMGG